MSMAAVAIPQRINKPVHNSCSPSIRSLCNRYHFFSSTCINMRNHPLDRYISYSKKLENIPKISEFFQKSRKNLLFHNFE